MLFKTFIKTTLQSIAAVIPIVTPIIILLLFISFILHKFRFSYIFHCHKNVFPKLSKKSPWMNQINASHKTRPASILPPITFSLIKLFYQHILKSNKSRNKTVTYQHNHFINFIFIIYMNRRIPFF